MLSDDTLQHIAEALDRAEREQSPIGQPALAFPAMTTEEAYAAQRRWADLKAARGVAQIGYKIGMTNHAAQKGMRTDEPVFGHLMGDRQFADGADIPIDRFNTPRIEIELAFKVGERLAGPGVTPEAALRATACITPAFELCAFRTQLPRNLIDTITDNCASAGLVLGGRTVGPFDADFRKIEVAMWKNGALTDSGVSSAVMGDPAASLAWLANKLGAAGHALNPGDIVLTGAITAPMTVERGDTVRADCGGLGALQVRFV